MPRAARMVGFGLPGDFGMSGEVELLPPVFMLLKDLHLLDRRMGRPREALEKAVKEVVIPSFKKTWEAEGRPEAWQDLAPDTLARKSGDFSLEGMSAYGSQPILISTPIQRQLGQHRRQGRGGATRDRAVSFKIWSFTKDSAYISGAGLFFDSPIHQFGAPSANIPARPFLLLQDEDLPKIEEVFAEWLDGLGKKFSVGI